MADNRGNRRGSAANNGQAVKGAEDFLKLSKYLKQVGQTELRKELNKALKDAAKPLLPKVKNAAATSLPKGGGLAKRIARKSYRVQVRTGASTAGVRITGSKVDPRIDEGRLFHPVFGRNVLKRPQQVKPGYFSETLAASGPDVRDDVVKALSDFADRITREGI